MDGYIDPTHFDLTTPDGAITSINRHADGTASAVVSIERISPLFVGFSIDLECVMFNIKSTLAQVGVDGIGEEIELYPQKGSARVKVKLLGIDALGREILAKLDVGSIIGKLFAADERRRVRDPDYLARMFGRSDRWGKPLLSLGGMQGSSDLILDRVDGYTVAYLTLQNGKFVYKETLEGFIPTLAKGLKEGVPMRTLLRMHQRWISDASRNLKYDELLLVKTLPLHIRTVFGKVVDRLLPSGFKHTSASVLQPDTFASGDIYELYGENQLELADIPLEFYTLEPYREHVFFSDRDQLKTSLENDQVLFDAFKTAPKPKEKRAATYVVKGTQLLSLTPDDWIARTVREHEFPGIAHSERQALMVERYIQQHPSYPFLKSIEEGLITSQGILLTRYFPAPYLKRMLLGDQMQRCLKAIYFESPSASNQQFFSSGDRALLHDLEKFAIPIFWVDEVTGRILRYVQKPDRDSGMFVPKDRVQEFLDSTAFGIYGSNLLEGNFEEELMKLLKGVLEMGGKINHPLLKQETPLSLITGGGTGAMAVGNRVAKELKILSCANIVDFEQTDLSFIRDQKQNPYVEAKMTYRIDKLIERQAEFNLDFPIFLMGGIGTDFEQSLEEVRRKVGAAPPTPILLFGPPEYWREKITSRFQCNLKSGTIRHSEWISNCFYVIQTAEQGLDVYRKFFTGTLPIGADFPSHEEGFVSM